MRFPTAILAATAMIALTFVQIPANATSPCLDNQANNSFTCCNQAPLFLWCAFDNHVLSDPTEALMVTAGQLTGTATPSAFAGCGATERQLYSTDSVTAGPVSVGVKNTPLSQFVKGMGGCLTLYNNTATVGSRDYAFYHVNIAALGGADDNLGWILVSPQVCFYDSGHTLLTCHTGFSSDDTSGGLDDSVTQLYQHQCIPAGAAFVDIEAPTGYVNVMSAFWQDPGFADPAIAPTLCDGFH